MPRRKPSKRSKAASKGWETRREKARIRETLKKDAAREGISGAQQAQIIRLLMAARKTDPTTQAGKKAWWWVFRKAGMQGVDLHEGRFYKGGRH